MLNIKLAKDMREKANKINEKELIETILNIESEIERVLNYFYDNNYENYNVEIPFKIEKYILRGIKYDLKNIQKELQNLGYDVYTITNNEELIIGIEYRKS